ncbi:MAG: hypothetical protein K0S09_3228 [Sphingobacteriaceae bacterium]|jgi:hypothetical protein|nr:hypothetical protein [Sphingobacteriaceae bacterium]
MSKDKGKNEKKPVVPGAKKAQSDYQTGKSSVSKIEPLTNTKSKK